MRGRRELGLIAAILYVQANKLRLFVKKNTLFLFVRALVAGGRHRAKVRFSIIKAEQWTNKAIACTMDGNRPLNGGGAVPLKFTKRRGEMS
jgi:hypothetical protein